MAKGKYLVNNQAWYRNSKLLAVILATTLVLGSVTGGTIAWLISKPEPVVNTFTYGDIDIFLTETDTHLDGDGNPNTNNYKMLPGQTIAKDPVITVQSGSEEMWLFVELKKSANFDDFMVFSVDESWVSLDGVDGVYYRHITADEVSASDKEIHVLANDTVSVKNEVTKENLNALDANGASNYPTLTVTAYGVQYAGNTTPADAWAKVTAPLTPTP